MDRYIYIFFFCIGTLVHLGPVSMWRLQICVTGIDTTVIATSSSFLAEQLPCCIANIGGHSAWMSIREHLGFLKECNAFSDLDKVEKWGKSLTVANSSSKKMICIH